MDLSHGHPPSPSSRGDHDGQQSFRHPQPNCSLSNTPPSITSPQQHDVPFSLQNRRLQLRNSGFRASRIPGQRLGVKLSRFFNGTETAQSEPLPPRNQENTSPHHRSTHSLQSEHRPSATLGILQEISNSTRSRYSQKRASVPILQDSPERPLLDDSPATTPPFWYHDASSTPQSPIPFYPRNSDTGAMKLREVSGNERRSLTPLNSPLAKPLKGRGKRSLDLRKTSFEASEYIEHIENELQQVKEAAHSPNTGKPLQEKVKILKAENKQLKQTLGDLEAHFEERLKEAMEHKSSIEVDMRRKIRSLEDELASKDCTIRDLEECNEQANYDRSRLDALRGVVERLEEEKQSLEETNRVVEKRNDALTGLLAQSPTRSHHCFEIASPVRQDSRRTPRPMSMMVPRIPSSPGLGHCDRPRSTQVSPTHSATGSFSPSAMFRLHEGRFFNGAGESDPQKQLDSQSFDSGLGESWSARSPGLTSSKRSSFASHGSPSTSAWGFPLPSSPSDDKGTARPSKHRRTRRFESGSTQLKPLLLPVMAAEGSGYQTTSLASGFSSPTRREFSEQSLDPTISFLSQPQELETPPPTNQPTSPWASDDALKALEGSAEPCFESFEDILARHEAMFRGTASSPLSKSMLDSSPCQHPCEQHPLNTQEEMSDEEDVTAFLDQPTSEHGGDGAPLSSMHAGASMTDSSLDPGWTGKQEPASQDHVVSMDSSLDSLEDTAAPRKRRKSSHRSSSLPVGFSLVEPSVQDCSPSRAANVGTEPKSLPTRLSSPAAMTMESTTTPRSRSPVERLQQRSISHFPLTSVTVRTIFGTLSRYTSYIREIRQDPTALARRVIANAWCSNWKRFGKLSWWVLGLFLGRGRRAEQTQAFKNAGWGWEQYDGEAIAGQVCHADRVCDHENVIPSSPGNTREGSGESTVRFGEQDEGYRTSGTKAKAKPALKQDTPHHQQRKTSWGKSLYLWGKFSVAIMLAVGGAVINGPEEMLKDCEEHAPKKALATRRAAGDGGDVNVQRHNNRSSHMVASEEREHLDHETMPAHVSSAGASCGADGRILQNGMNAASSPLNPPASARPSLQPAFEATSRNRMYTFGSPCQNGWDYFDDNGCVKATRSRNSNCDTEGDSIYHHEVQEGHDDLGTLEWMQHLRLSDFPEMDDGEATVRGGGRKGKRRHSFMS